MDKLLPCPFCGGEVEIDMLDSENSRNVKIYSAVHCPKCHQWFFKGLSKEKTVAAWNRRTGKDINVATNNAVPVVRCGECDRRIKSADLTNTVLCGWLHKITMNKDDFCSYGAKMEDKP